MHRAEAQIKAEIPCLGRPGIRESGQALGGTYRRNWGVGMQQTSLPPRAPPLPSEVWESSVGGRSRGPGRVPPGDSSQLQGSLLESGKQEFKPGTSCLFGPDFSKYSTEKTQEQTTPKSAAFMQRLFRQKPPQSRPHKGTVAHPNPICRHQAGRGSQAFSSHHC